MYPTALCAATPALETQAQQLAAHWGFPLQASKDAPYTLVLTEQRLELRPQGDDGRGAIAVDWLAVPRTGAASVVVAANPWHVPWV